MLEMCSRWHQRCGGDYGTVGFIVSCFSLYGFWFVWSLCVWKIELLRKKPTPHSECWACPLVSPTQEGLVYAWTGRGRWLRPPRWNQVAAFLILGCSRRQTSGQEIMVVEVSWCIEEFAFGNFGLLVVVDPLKLLVVQQISMAVVVSFDHFWSFKLSGGRCESTDPNSHRRGENVWVDSHTLIQLEFFGQWPLIYSHRMPQMSIEVFASKRLPSFQRLVCPASGVSLTS